MDVVSRSKSEAYAEVQVASFVAKRRGCKEVYGKETLDSLLPF